MNPQQWVDRAAQLWLGYLSSPQILLQVLPSAYKAFSVLQ